MRSTVLHETIACMKTSRRKRRRHRYRSAGMELAGALSIASQMALLCPPSFDQWVRQELSGESAGDRRRNDRVARSGR
jgi:hypothetical protein